MNTLDEINLDHVLAEVKTVFSHYESALINNDTDMLDQYFWQSPLVVRFGESENLYGIEAIRAFRKARDRMQGRILFQTRITTFGSQFATTTTEFVRDNMVKGRQSQTWVLFAEGWRIVSAHISLY